MLAIQPNAIRYTPGFMGEYIRGRTFSERMDEEWNRLIMCCSITSVPIGLGGRRFSPSSLIGSWSGNILVCLSILRFEFETGGTDFQPP